jgi:hypothetical protein
MRCRAKDFRLNRVLARSATISEHQRRQRTKAANRAISCFRVALVVSALRTPPFDAFSLALLISSRVRSSAGANSGSVIVRAIATALAFTTRGNFLGIFAMRRLSHAISAVLYRAAET